MSNIEARNYIDESTTKEFRFVFLCDCCGKVVLEYVEKNENEYKLKLFKKQKDKEKEWIKGHDKAFKAARQLAIQKLNRCEVCGKLVCDDCVSEPEHLCGGLSCKKCNK